MSSEGKRTALAALFTFSQSEGAPDWPAWTRTLLISLEAKASCSSSRTGMPAEALAWICSIRASEWRMGAFAQPTACSE